MTAGTSARSRLVLNILFAAAFGYVEAAVVVYLRALYYPGGFQFPLRIFEPGLLSVELFREAATLVMLGAVAVLSGRTHWDRFGAFLVALVAGLTLSSTLHGAAWHERELWGLYLAASLTVLLLGCGRYSLDSIVWKRFGKGGGKGAPSPAKK